MTETQDQIESQEPTETEEVVLPKDDRVLSLEEVLKLVPIARRTIDDHEKDGRFPRRVKCGGRVGWLNSEIQAYIANLPRAGDEPGSD